MSEDTRFTADSITARGEDPGPTVDQPANDIASFKARLAGFGNPFGGDDLGAAMRMAYDTITEIAVECLDDNTAIMAETGGWPTTTARWRRRITTHSD